MGDGASTERGRVNETKNRKQRQDKQTKEKVPHL
jgi:hypothetical protein|tara:strand:+ start:1779 stop:1880 length:102 start_codon:yes stop_codon:yes gene_type:complete